MNTMRKTMDWLEVYEQALTMPGIWFEARHSVRKTDLAYARKQHLEARRDDGKLWVMLLPENIDIFIESKPRHRVKLEELKALLK